MTTVAVRKPPQAIISLTLPGPDRKRTESLYHFRVAYRNPDPTEPGCLMTWEVFGGREPYQVSLERAADGGHRWHCSCADAVYRGDGDYRHLCKHVHGLVECFPVRLAVSRKATSAA